MSFDVDLTELDALIKENNELRAENVRLAGLNTVMELKKLRKENVELREQLEIADAGAELATKKLEALKTGKHQMRMTTELVRADIDAANARRLALYEALCSVDTTKVRHTESERRMRNEIASIDQRIDDLRWVLRLRGEDS